MSEIVDVRHSLTEDPEMKVRVGVSIAVTTNNTHDILIAQRKNAHGAGEWAIPGGSVDPGETTVQAAIRELGEETDLRVKKHDLELMNTCVNNFPEQGIEWVTILFRLRLSQNLGNNRNVKNMEHNKKEGLIWTWADWRRLPYPLFTPLAHINDNGVLRRVLDDS